MKNLFVHNGESSQAMLTRYRISAWWLFLIAFLIVSSVVAVYKLLNDGSSEIFKHQGYLPSANIPSSSVRNSPTFELQVTQPLLSGFQEEFLGKMRKLMICQLTDKCPVRLLIYQCGSFDESCGGLGDRLRGLISMLYAAYASDRVLIINWKVPADIGEIFAINEELYGVNYGDRSQSIFDVLFQKVVKLRNSQRYFYYNLTDASALVSSIPVVRYTTVSLDLLKQTLERPVFREKLRPLMDIVQYNLAKVSGVDFGYELASFLALQTLLRKPKQAVTDAVKSLETKMEALEDKSLNKSIRLAIHLRVTPKKIYNRVPDMPRITPRQLEECLLPRVTSKTSIVYVASDSVSAKNFVINKLKLRNIRAFAADVEAHHINSDSRNVSHSFLQKSQVETFAELLFLSRMNQLLITRSGFSEMASTLGSFLSYRVAPTQRLQLTGGDECIFDEDYHVKTYNVEPFRLSDDIFKKRVEESIFQY